MLARKGSAGCPPAGLGSESGDPFTFWRPLTWPWRGPGVALACHVGRWCGARFRPQPLQNLSGSIVFSMPSKGSAVALRGTLARARNVKRFTFIVV